MKTIISLTLVFSSLGLVGVPASAEDTATLEVGKFSKDYELKPPAPNADVKIPYVYDFSDNVELVRLSADKLAHKLVRSGWHMDLDTIVIPGNKASSVGVELTQILRHLKPHIKMVVLLDSANDETLHKVSYTPLTSSESKDMVIRSEQVDNIEGKSVLILDDVISGGTTVKAAKTLVEKVGGHVVGFACVATEGSRDPGDGMLIEGLPVVRVTHLPSKPVKDLN